MRKAGAGGISGRPGCAADWLGLAAAPSFLAMAMLSAVLGDGGMAMVCSTQPWPALGGMTPMYLLMGAFHVGPWLRLIGQGRRGARQPG